MNYNLQQSLIKVWCAKIVVQISHDCVWKSHQKSINGNCWRKSICIVCCYLYSFHFYLVYFLLFSQFQTLLLNRSHRSRHHIFFWQIDVNTNATIVWEYIFAIFVMKSRLKWKLLLSCQSIIGIDGKYRCWLVYIYYMRMLTLISTTSCITYNWPWFFHYRIWSIVTTEQYATFNQIERKNDSRI